MRGRNARKLAQLRRHDVRACRFTRDIFDTELVIRGERAGFRLLELPVTVAEQRPPRSSIFGRAPGAAWNLLKLYVVLSRDVSRRSSPMGMIIDRQTTSGAVGQGDSGLASAPATSTDPAASVEH